MDSSLRGHAAMLGANVMWGLMSPVSKVVMASGAVTPMVVTMLRIAGAMILFWGVSFFCRDEHVGHKDLITLFFASLFAIVLNQGSFIFGVSMTSPGEASIITTSMPLWAMVLAAFILHEPVTGKKVLGIAFGAAGALTLILGSTHTGGQGAASATRAHWGDLLVIFAQFSYAFYLVRFKHFVERYSLVTIMKWMFTYAFICTLPFSARDLLATPWASLPAIDAAGLVYVVVCGTFLSYMLIVVGQKTLRPTVAGMYNYIQPVVACCVAVAWGLDTFNIAKALAVVMIFAGVYMVTTSRARNSAMPRKA
jgi:drug/metabolite transporter (DMT)-like permease